MRPAKPSWRRSSMPIATVPGRPQQGQKAPFLFIVPCPSFLSFSRLWAALVPTTGTFDCTPKTTPVRSGFGPIVSKTRFFSFLQSHLVLSRGSSARQFLQVTVLAHRQATVGLEIHLRLCLFRRYSSEKSAFNEATSGLPSESV